MKKQNANKGELGWLENEDVNIANRNEIDNLELLDLSLFKNSQVINKADFSSLLGKVEHEPEISSPDAYYIDDESMIIVGYEHFLVTTTKELGRGAKSLASLGRISKKSVPFREINIEKRFFCNEVCNDDGFFTFRKDQKHELLGVRKTPWFIEHNILFAESKNLFNEDVVISDFNCISTEDLTLSVAKNLDNHVGKVDKYIENLSTLRSNYKVKLNFVIDMSYVVIPTLKVEDLSGNEYRYNYLIYGGISELIKEIRHNFDTIWELNSKGYEIGVIIIAPNVFCPYESKGYMPFHLLNYTAFHIKHDKDIESLLLNNNSLYIKDDMLDFQQALYSFYDKNLFKTERGRHKKVLLLRSEVSQLI